MVQRSCLVFAVFVAVTISVSAQQPAVTQLERVTVAEVEVRAGPTLKFPATGKLQLGDSVRVRGRKDDFLEIDPPAGSLSWVSAALVSQINPATLIVQGESETLLRVGSALVRQPLPVELSKVKPGTQLFVMGQKVTFENGEWWPIRPISGESRYIPASAIALPAPGASASARTITGKNASSGSTSEKE